MQTATRLVRRGHLADATAALLRAARGVPSAAAVPEWRIPSSARNLTLPAHPSQAGKFLAHSYTGDAGTRDYKLYVSAECWGKPSSLLVMLHGCTQSADDFQAGTRMNSVAEENRCLVAYPVQPASANQSKCWNWFNPKDQKRDHGEPSLIVGIVRQIARDYCVDPNRIYVAGLSAGGAAAVVLGTEYPDVFAAIGVHSGVACGVAHDLPSAFAAMHGRSSKGLGAPTTGKRTSPRRTPTIVFHGDRDSTVHPSNATRVLAATCGTAGVPSTSETMTAPGGRDYTRTTYARRWPISRRVVGSSWSRSLVVRR